MANSYLGIDDFLVYMATRGNTSITASPVETLQTALVRATDYLDQKYRYKGIKKVQKIGNAILDPNLQLIDPSLYPSSISMVPFLAPSTTFQELEWPRQGVVDYSGDTITGVPRQIKNACAELANRVLNDIELQPDYDSDVVKSGGIVSSMMDEVGPIKTQRTFDTQAGLGFFPDFPQITRMLQKAGLLLSGGGRSVLR